MSKSNIGRKKHKSVSWQWVLIASFIVCVPLVIFAAFVYAELAPFISHSEGSNLNFLAKGVMVRCESASDRATCYDREIPKLMDFISMEDAFKVTKIIQNQDSSYAFCHILGHNLSTREVAKDPSKWKDVLTRCPSGECSNGCLHGGLQEKFRSEFLTDAQIEEIIPELETLCEPRNTWRPTGLEQGSCYHALGHMLMIMASADTTKAATLCDRVVKESSGRDFTQVCYDGVFMQIFQPLEPDDFALVEGKVPERSKVVDYCRAFSPLKQSSCLSESWPLFTDQILDPKAVVGFCNQDGQFSDRCFTAIFNVVPVQFNLDGVKLENYCSGVEKTSLKGQCFASAASRLIEVDYQNVDRAVFLCKTAAKYGLGNRCYEELVKYSTFLFHKGSHEFSNLCNKLPKEWKDKCLASN